MAKIYIELVNNKFKARVRITKKGQKPKQKSKTFDTRAKAETWAKNYIAKILTEGFPEGNSTNLIAVPIGELINMYLFDETVEATLGKTKKAVLNALKFYDIARIPSDQLTANDLINHCRTRIAEEHCPKPQTVYQDVTYLKSVMDIAEAFFKVRVDLSYHTKAMPALVKYNLVGRSEERIRRPTSGEMETLEAAILARQSHHSNKIPLLDIVHFSIETCMRLGETTRVTWQDFDEIQGKILIKDRKDPRKKKGNNMEIPLSKEAIEIIKRQPRNLHDDRIFPYKSGSVSTAWQNICKKHGIVDLHFHDLRAEGACRLYESGMDIVSISKITGHRDINILNNIYLRLGLTQDSAGFKEKFTGLKEKSAA